MNLRKVIDLLERHLPLTAGDKRILDTELLQLEGTVKDVGSTIGPGGRVTQMVSGNVLIGQQYGLWITNPDGGATTVALEPDGDVRIGSDVNDVTRTGLNVFSHDQRYNGEILGEGDILFGDNSASKANMFWDRSAGQMRFRSGMTDKITIGTDGNFIIANQLRSSAYVAGLAGFLIDGPTGDAEFNNITARGSIITSVFVKNLIEAKAGSMMIAYSAGMLHADMTVPTSGIWAARITDPPGGGFLFQNGDICKVKEVFTTSVIELFFTVSDRADLGGGIQTYQCIYGSGDRSVQRTYTAGLPVVDMGQSGQGYLYMTADDTGAPFYSVRSWVTNPWTAGNITERARLGNMNGAFGTGANNRYGFGVGDYAGGNYLSYNAAVAGGFLIKAGSGNISLDADGLSLQYGNLNETIIKWKDSGGATFFQVNGYITEDVWAHLKLKNADNSTLYLESLTNAEPTGATVYLYNGGAASHPEIGFQIYYGGAYGPELYIGLYGSNRRFAFINGNVGIGTTEPGATLDVVGNVLVGATAFAGYGAPAPKMEIYDVTRTSTDVDSGSLVLYGTTNVAGGGAALTLGSWCTSFWGTFGRIRGVKDNATAGQHGGGLAFDSRANGANFAQIMAITSDKKVGIMTTDPKSVLHVVGLPVYANNAAAVAGGLTAGAFYRTGVDPDPVCVVH